MSHDQEIDLTKKELYSLKSDEFIKRDLTQDIFSKHIRDFLNIHTHQIFCRNFFNADATHKGLILEHDTGTGKTITACAIIMTFIKAYKKSYESIASKTTSYGLEKIATLENETPYVLIVGFEGTQDAFFRELTAYPEFGYVTPMERDQFIRAKQATERMDATIDDQRRYRELYLKFRRRLSDKSNGGFFDFKGFQELVNHIFDTSGADISLDYIEKEATSSGKTVAEVFNGLIENGTFRPRKENLMKYKNALVVVDELHNTYNSVGKNSRGIVLQYIIDNVPGIRFLGLSATLLNSSPAEFVDVLNYLLPDKLRRDSYFVELHGSMKFARPSVPEELGRLSYGYFSFLKDSNPKYYPRLILEGEPLYTQTGEVKYQRFYKVPMSRELQEAHETVVQEHGIDPDTGRIRVPINSEIVFDMTLPLPTSEKNIGKDASKDTEKITNKIKYVYSTDQVGRILANAPTDFLDRNGINIVRDAEGIRMTGPFLTSVNLLRWSPKYNKMLEVLLGAKGKCVIFHKKVRGSGVLLIEEILKTNGYIGEDTEPHADSICNICQKKMSAHKQIKDHIFVPTRYALVYGQNKSDIPGILQRYNAATNSTGSRCKILIGSKVIRESYDFKDVRHMFMVDCPVNISMTLQIYGRAVRKNSHINLDPEDRTVSIHTFVSMINPDFPTTVKDSAEAQRYKIKMDAYLLIQQVDKYRHAYAIDASINKGTIWPTGNPGKDSLGALYYEPIYNVADHLSLDDLRTDTFRARKFFTYEISTLSMIIKRLFINKNIWTYKELWKTVLDPPFPVETNPKLFDESLFMITLSQLVNAPNFNVDNTDSGNIPMSVLVNRLVDPAERRVTLETGVFRIVHSIQSNTTKMDSVNIGKDNATGKNTCDIKDGYYILVPCDSQGQPVVDAGIYDQRPPGSTRRYLNIDRLIAGSHTTKKYIKGRSDIIKSLDGLDSIEDFADFLLTWPVNIQELFIQDCIKINARAKVADISDRDSKALKEVSQLILSGLQLMGATITFEEMKTYKLAPKYYTKDYQMDTIVGYESLESVRIMTQDGTFVDIAKTILNRMEIFREVQPVIGYIEDLPGSPPKFKIRKSIDNDTTNSRDSTERGIVCHTKTKEQLLELMNDLNIKTTVHRTKTYCREIFMNLLDKEIEARETFSKNKYMYSWWNKVPL